MTTLDHSMIQPIPQPTNILHIVNGEHYAGAARVQDLLAQHLPDHGYNAHFATLLEGRFAEQRKCQSAPLKFFPMKHRLDFSPAKAIAEYAKQNNIALLHSHTTRSAMIAAAASRFSGIPFVHHVHCQMNTEVGSRFKTQLNLWIERTACRQAAATIAVSNSIQQFMARSGFRTQNTHVVPNGVPEVATQRRPREAGEPWTIGMVALLRQRKGLETLLKCLPLLKSDAGVKLKIVGPFESPEYEHTIRALADDLRINSQIEWTGFSTDVPAELLDMDILVLPSVLAEGMPMVLLEAMAAGVPIVGSEVDGIIDVIRHEQNGLLAEPGCRDSLAHQLNRILTGQTDWHFLRTNCLLDFQSQYSSAVMAENVANVYCTILPTEGSPELRQTTASEPQEVLA